MLLKGSLFILRIEYEHGKLNPTLVMYEGLRNVWEI